MNEKLLFSSVMKKYNHPGEIDYLECMSHTGFEDYEEILIDDYFTGNGRVLVIGCGTGRETFAFASRNFQVTAIDIAEDAVRAGKKIACEQSVRANFLTMNGCNLGFKSSVFDYVILFSQVISLVPMRKNRIGLLMECKRVLSENGLVIFTTHSRNRTLTERIKWRIINFIRKIIPIPGTFFEEGDKWVKAISGYNITDDKVFMHLYSMAEGLEDIKNAGLNLIDCRCATEVVNRRVEPKIRETDKYIVYIAGK